MSMFENNHYRWRETYFVLFRSSHRPKVKKVEQLLAALNEHYELREVTTDSQGRFESLTLISPDDFAALDICYTDGAEVLEQGAALAQEIRPGGEAEVTEAALKRLVQCDARFDVLHFEQIAAIPEENEDDDMLDPSALLLVLGALARLTDGLAVDPQAGTFLSNDE